MFFPLYDSNPTVRKPVLTVALIAVNLLAFLYAFTLPPAKQEQLIVQRGFVPARLAHLDAGQPVRIDGEYARYTLLPNARSIYQSALTCMFLHAGWMHLIGNMWFLWIFGNNIEDLLGHVRYLVLYFAGGLIATTTQYLTGPEQAVPVIGASGAVAAVLGAYLVKYPHARVKTLVFLVIFITIIDLPALLVLGVWFAMQLAEGVKALDVGIGGGVAWWAHLGGFAAGAVLVILLSLGIPDPRRQAPQRRVYPPQDYYR